MDGVDGVVIAPTDFTFLTSKDLPLVITEKAFCCPDCGGRLVVEDIDEWETEGGRVTESGFHINCEAEPDIGSDKWEDWDQQHWSHPYGDWLPLESRVYEWFDRRYRYSPDEPPTAEEKGEGGGE